MVARRSWGCQETSVACAVTMALPDDRDLVPAVMVSVVALSTRGHYTFSGIRSCNKNLPELSRFFPLAPHLLPLQSLPTKSLLRGLAAPHSSTRIISAYVKVPGPQQCSAPLAHDLHDNSI